MKSKEEIIEKYREVLNDMKELQAAAEELGLTKEDLIPREQLAVTNNLAGWMAAIEWVMGIEERQ